MDLEKIYKYSNYVAFVVAVFLFGTVMSMSTPWWLPLVVLLFPTAVFLVVVFGALLWSFYLTKDDDES